MFRYKSGIPLSYDRQGYIYFTSRLYKELSPKDQEKIRNLCCQSAGQHWRAVYMYVTTSANATWIEQNYHISKAQLHRYVQKYYMNFPKKL